MILTVEDAVSHALGLRELIDDPEDYSDEQRDALDLLILTAAASTERSVTA